MKVQNGFERACGISVLVLSAAAAVLFGMSYTTGYYVFGQMQSVTITALLAAGIVVEVLAIAIRSKKPAAFWPKLLTFAVTALLAGASMLILGDRVEGIGNCIVTDYDSGHGGEEAIYMSIAATVLLLLAVIFNIIGSFSKDPQEAPSKGKAAGRNVTIGIITLALLAGVIYPTQNLVRTGSVIGSTAAGKTGSGESAQMAAGGSYTITYNGNLGNAEDCPGYQFLCSDLGGFLRYDTRMFIDVKLDLDGNGGYSLLSDAYVIEAGKRAEIGDDTGLGQVINTTAEGTYTDNGDGSVVISRPEHAVFTMQTDTYSAQMKEAASMEVDGHTEDGVYDSAEYPVVLDFVPETLFVLEGDKIISYRDANAGGTYTVSYNVNSGNAENMPDYQFLCSNFKGMVNADSRFFVDITLDLDGNDAYTLFADAYVVESGNRAVVGDDTGLGLVLTMNAEGSYTDNGDGTYTTQTPDHAVFEMQTDTYSAQMKEAASMQVDGNSEDGVYDSADVPAVLDFVPETIWTLEDGAIVEYYDPAAEEEAAEGENAEGEAAEDEAAEDAEGSNGAAEWSVTIPSEDEATKLTFNGDGSYVFAFDAYGIEDAGTYTYEDGVLTLTDANGKETKAEGDPLEFVYTYSQSDQLTGSFKVAAAELEQPEVEEAAEGENAEGTEEAAEDAAAWSVTVPSEDEATKLTFNGDGSYVFAFDAYGIEDAGTYTYEDGVLTLTDANGKETKAEGDPLEFVYTYSQSDQLTGSFKVAAADLQAK